ncbi:hypothetical protein Hypma_005400 [Hypsizygus marmoreus]|uniref:Uncharacterized protein n=1 Tax=Hypsizygus marmoreus TaxID=39966 RepID=A0A369JWT5_HYPMA|nr:hypothetical protein Hypma_005400 [Hypsizygus marmoreus]
MSASVPHPTTTNTGLGHSALNYSTDTPLAPALQYVTSRIQPCTGWLFPAPSPPLKLELGMHRVIDLEHVQDLQQMLQSRSAVHDSLSLYRSPTIPMTLQLTSERSPLTAR